MKKILIIEDNEDIRENIAEILELADYEAITAANGKEGVSMATEHLPDLIICDIMMPELDGYGVLHILAKKENTKGIPFIFLTAKAERSDLRKGMALGADDYLTKPFEDTELLDAIEIRLKKSEFHSRNDQVKGDGRSMDELLKEYVKRKPRIYKKKNDIYRIGDGPLNVYYIISGKIKTLRVNEDGKEFITNIYDKGEFFGYEAILLNHQHTDNAEAIEDCEILSVNKDEFSTLMEQNSNISKAFIELLSNRVVDKEEKLLHLAYDSVRQRTADALIQLNTKFEGDDNITISRQDISNMVGTATESVIRVMSDLRDEGIIDITSGKVKILDTEKLDAIKRWHTLR